MHHSMKPQPLNAKQGIMFSRCGGVCQSDTLPHGPPAVSRQFNFRTVHVDLRIFLEITAVSIAMCSASIRDVVSSVSFSLTG